MQQIPLADFSSILIESNVFYDAVIIIAGLTFSIVSLLLTVVKGVSIGYLLVTQNIVQSTYVIQGLLLILPLILALTGALLVTKMEIRLFSSVMNGNFKDLFSKIKVPLKDLILTITFMLILIILLWIIELIL